MRRTLLFHFEKFARCDACIVISRRVIGTLLGALICALFQSAMALPTPPPSPITPIYKKSFCKMSEEDIKKIKKQGGNVKLIHILEGEVSSYRDRNNKIQREVSGGHSKKHIDIKKVVKIIPGSIRAITGTQLGQSGNPQDDYLYNAKIASASFPKNVKKSESTMFPINWKESEIEEDVDSLILTLSKAGKDDRNHIGKDGFVTKTYSGFWVKVYMDDKNKVGGKTELDRYKGGEAYGKINFFPISNPSSKDVFIPTPWDPQWSGGPVTCH